MGWGQEIFLLENSMGNDDRSISEMSHFHKG